MFYTPGWGAILAASGGGTLAGVIVTQVFNVRTRRIDAKTRDADRQQERDIRNADHQHERAMAYQERVWQAKHDALTRLVSACRFVNWQAQLTGAENTDEKLRRALTIRALDLFRDRIGGEDGISEITAYAAEPVREALDVVLEEVNEQRNKHLSALVILRQVGTRWDAVVKEPLIEPTGAVRIDPQALDPRILGLEPASVAEPQQLMAQRSYLVAKRQQALDDIGGNSDLDVDAVIAVCDRVIDVARKDLQGRDTE